MIPIASAAVNLTNILQCRHVFRDPVDIQDTCPDETFTVAALSTVSDLQNSWKEVSALQQHFTGDTELSYRAGAGTGAKALTEAK